MFTGLIERLGTLQSVEEDGDARRLKIGVMDDEYLRDAHIGDSISVAGVCLTATELGARHFCVEAVEETMRRTSLGARTVGDVLNLERALLAGARLGGHIVQGHVDGVGHIHSVRDEGRSWWVTIEPPSGLLRYVAEKGSVCVDGISLTVANVSYTRFSVAVIPHTWNATTAQHWRDGAPVNLETDIIAKYVERLTQFARGPEPA